MRCVRVLSGQVHLTHQLPLVLSVLGQSRPEVVKAAVHYAVREKSGRGGPWPAGPLETLRRPRNTLLIFDPIASLRLASNANLMQQMAAVASILHF
jgi:hypothetical protein